MSKEESTSFLKYQLVIQLMLAGASIGWYVYAMHFSNSSIKFDGLGELLLSMLAFMLMIVNCVVSVIYLLFIRFKQKTYNSDTLKMWALLFIVTLLSTYFIYFVLWN